MYNDIQSMSTSFPADEAASLLYRTMQSSYVHFGNTRLYRYMKTVSNDLSCPSNTHFIWPCVPVIYKMVLIRNGIHHSGLLLSTRCNCIPKDSLM